MAEPTAPSRRDALVNPAAEGIGGWIGRVGAITTRGSRPLYAIFALTHALPQVVFALFTVGAVTFVLDLAGMPRLDDQVQLDPGAGSLVVAGLCFAMSLVLQLIGYAAATYTATRAAAGLRTRSRDALRFGVRRWPGLLGYTSLTVLLSGTVLAVGACLTLALGKGGGTTPTVIALLVLIPIAVCAAMLLAMVGPTYLFQRRNALIEGWILLSGGFGAVLGRLTLIFLAELPGAYFIHHLLGIQLLNAESNADTKVATALLLTAMIAVAQLPFTVLQFAGVLVTYAERRNAARLQWRADGHPLTAGVLAAELDAPLPAPRL